MAINRDTVIRLAREAVNSGDGSELSGDAIERFAQLVFLEAAESGRITRPAVKAAAEAEGLHFVSRSHGLTTTDTVSLDVLTNIVRTAASLPVPPRDARRTETGRGVMAEPKATQIAFEKRYSDDSGVEFGVRYASHPWPGRIEFESVGEVSFPVEELDWLIECLQRIRNEVAAPQEGRTQQTQRKDGGRQE